jgi:VWFA-related protein
MRDPFRLACAATLALALPLAANVAPPQASVVGESIDVRVVNVEAVVTDKAGRRVHGLGAGDLRLLVDGREMPVEYFTEVEDGRTGKGSEAAGDPIARNYLVYVDDSFSLLTRRNAVLDKLEADLSLLRPTDRMAILAFDGTRIDVLSGWTADVEQLRAALARARQRQAFGNKSLTSQRALGRDEQWVKDMANSISSGDSVSGGGGGYGDEVQALLEWMSYRIPLEARTQVGRTAPAVAASLSGFEAPPGRKVLLYLTGAWSLEIAAHFNLYGPLIAVANQAGYTLYPVDTAKSDAVEISDLDDLAKATGGRALVSTSDEVFRQAVADSGSYYWLGFSPTWKANDEGHRIVVQALRPGLQVRARTGFSDLSRRTEVVLKAESILLFGGAKEDERLIVQVGENDDTEKVRVARRAPKTVKVPFTLGVPVESLLLTPQGTGFLAELPLAIKAEDFQRRQSDLPPLRLRVTFAERPKNGTYARFRTVLELRNVDQRLVFTVQDPLSGRPLWGQAAIQPTSPCRAGAAGREW